MKKLNEIVLAMQSLGHPIIGLSGDINDKNKIRIDFADSATDEQRQAAQAALQAFDVTGPSQDIPKFFNDLVLAILAGVLPGDVHVKAKMVQDLKNPADQAAALIALAADPVYSKEQKQALDALIKSAALALPEVPEKE